MWITFAWFASLGSWFMAHGRRKGGRVPRFMVQVPRFTDNPTPQKNAPMPVVRWL
jgi:hypothetical protein